MARDPREVLGEFRSGLEKVMAGDGEVARAYLSLRETSVKPKALDTKTKELIGVAISVFNRCEYCIAVHVNKAFEAGATAEEIQEAGLHAVLFGGGAALAYSVTFLKNAIEVFAPDSKG
jgi:AhpD family alkylhydroperoxidase